jgi:hypothetical protein
MYEDKTGSRRHSLGWRYCVLLLALMVGFGGVIACGGDDDPVPLPRPPGPSSNWDDMKWDEGVWGA